MVGMRPFLLVFLASLSFWDVSVASFSIPPDWSSLLWHCWAGPRIVLLSRLDRIAIKCVVDSKYADVIFWERESCLQIRMPDKNVEEHNQKVEREEIPKSWILGDFMRRFLSGGWRRPTKSVLPTSLPPPTELLLAARWFTTWFEICRSYDQSPNLATLQVYKVNSRNIPYSLNRNGTHEAR